VCSQYGDLNRSLVYVSRAVGTRIRTGDDEIYLHLDVTHDVSTDQPNGIYISCL